MRRWTLTPEDVVAALQQPAVLLHAIQSATPPPDDSLAAAIRALDHLNRDYTVSRLERVMQEGSLQAVPDFAPWLCRKLGVRSDEQ